MKDIRNLNIWKNEKPKKDDRITFLETDIADLGLSVRSYNCLKRYGYNTIKDILSCMEVEQGLRKLKGLGLNCEREIHGKINELESSMINRTQTDDSEKLTGQFQPRPPKRYEMRQNKEIWDLNIEMLNLSDYALQRLKSCGICLIRDLYATRPKLEPGWYAVREVFEKLPKITSFAE